MRHNIIKGSFLPLFHIIVSENRDIVVQNLINSIQPKYYLSFTKTPGLRFTEIKLESYKNLIQANEENIYFKIVPLFDNQKLDIKNSILEIESFSDLPGNLPKNLPYK